MEFREYESIPPVTSEKARARARSLGCPEWVVTEKVRGVHLAFYVYGDNDVRLATRTRFLRHGERRGFYNADAVVQRCQPKVLRLQETIGPAYIVYGVITGVPSDEFFVHDIYVGGYDIYAPYDTTARLLASVGLGAPRLLCRGTLKQALQHQSTSRVLRPAWDPRVLLQHDGRPPAPPLREIAHYVNEQRVDAVLRNASRRTSKEYLLRRLTDEVLTSWTSDTGTVWGRNDYALARNYVTCLARPLLFVSSPS